MLERATSPLMTSMINNLDIQYPSYVQVGVFAFMNLKDIS